MLVDVTIIGITGLMMDKFTIDQVDKGPKTTNTKHEPTPKEQAAGKLYLDDKGIPVWPADNLLKSIIDAGRFIKIGKRQLTTRDETIVTSFLSIVERYLPVKTEHGWRVDSRGIVNQATKGRHPCHRPVFDDWQMKFTLDVDLDETKRETVRELVDRAGKAIGIGVMRPSRKGSFGKFKVLCWEERKSSV